MLVKDLIRLNQTKTDKYIKEMIQIHGKVFMKKYKKNMAVDQLAIFK